MPPSGTHRDAELITALGADVLLLTEFSGKEALGRLSEYKAIAISTRPDIAADELLGKNVSVRVAVGSAQRYFNGYTTRFSQLGMTVHSALEGRKAYAYELVIHPWLWMLTRSTDSRAFQGLSVTEVIDRTLASYGGQVESLTTATCPALAYCVQYRESDFDFVSRLWEREGLYYYFAHEDGAHTLKIADDPSGHSTGTFAPTLSYRLGGDDQQVIDSFVAVGEVRAGKYTGRDFDFAQSRVTIEGTHSLAGSHPFGDLDVFDYPGGPAELPEGGAPAEDATRRARVRMEELRAQQTVYRGSGNTRGIEVGSVFTLEGHFADALNQDYVTVSHQFMMKVDDYQASTFQMSYDMTFTAIVATDVFRSERTTPVPHVRGPHTAIVTGPSGEEIHTDAFGRVRVQFHWDRYAGSQSETNAIDTSCWVRVAHPWAGKAWGMIALPRVGQEVVVDFLEGDPDRPLITNRLYNDISRVPYALPDNKTQMTIKSSSIGGGGFNELRFDDKAGEEQVFLHAQKQMDVRVLADRFEFIGATDQRIVTTDLIEKVDGDAHLEVGGDQNEKVIGTVSLDAGADWQVKVAQNTALDSGSQIHLKGGQTIIIEAGSQISLKVGGNFINISASGIDIQGMMTKVNSGGSAGSGSGASPAAPTAPQEAATGEAGELDQAAAAVAPPEVTNYSPEAVALQRAAGNGAPFVDGGS